MGPFHERRSGLVSLSSKYELLSPSQRRTLHSLEESGWHLIFIRHSFYLSSIPIVVDDSTGKMAIIDKCGLVKTSHGLHFREPEPGLRTLH